MPLKNVCNLRTMGISEKVEINLISFFDYGLVEVGGYFNVAIDQTGDYSNNLSSLTKVNDVRGFTYWAGPKNWIYESGADNSGVYIPEIYVNNSLYSSGNIHYREGYVTNIPTNATSVKAKYSYRWATVVSAKRQINGNYSVVSTYNAPSLLAVARSGSAETSYALPIISIDVPNISKVRPYGLGAVMEPSMYYYDVNINVFGEFQSDVLRLSDVISKQRGYTINTFDPDEVRASGNYPLNLNGTLNTGKSHDQLVALHPWEGIHIVDVVGKSSPDLKNGLYQSSLVLTAKVASCGCT